MGVKASQPNRNGSGHGAVTKFELSNLGIVSGGVSFTTSDIEVFEGIAASTINIYTPIKITTGVNVEMVSVNSDHGNKFIGIALNAATTGNRVTVQLNRSITNTSWAFTAGKPVYIGNNVLTQTTTLSYDWKFFQRAGMALSATRVMLAPEYAIISVPITSWSLDGGSGLYYASVAHNLERELVHLTVVNMETHWYESGISFDHIEWIDLNTLKLWRDTNTFDNLRVLCL